MPLLTIILTVPVAGRYVRPAHDPAARIWHAVHQLLILQAVVLDAHQDAGAERDQTLRLLQDDLVCSFLVAQSTGETSLIEPSSRAKMSMNQIDPTGGQR